MVISGTDLLEPYISIYDMPIFKAYVYKGISPQNMMNINFHKELDSFLNMGSNIPNDSWLISRIRDDDGHMTFV